MIKACIILICSVNFMSHIVNGANTEKINEQEILDRLFEEDGTLSVSETESYLKDLKNLYSTKSNKVTSSAKIKKLVLELAELPNQADCFQEKVYERFYDLYTDHFFHSNIADFIFYYQNWYTLKCRSEFTNAYAKSVSGIPESSRDKLFYLSKDVMSISEGMKDDNKIFYTAQSLAQAVYNLFEHELVGEDRTGGFVSRYKMKKLYKKTVGQICEFLGDDFKKPAKNFLKDAVNNKRVIVSLDYITAYRMIIANICYDIENNNDKLMDSVLKLVKENQNKT